MLLMPDFKEVHAERLGRINNGLMTAEEETEWSLQSIDVWRQPWWLLK